jgi:hypothetical protein
MLFSLAASPLAFSSREQAHDRADRASGRTGRLLVVADGEALAASAAERFVAATTPPWPPAVAP